MELIIANEAISHLVGRLKSLFQQLKFEMLEELFCWKPYMISNITLKRSSSSSRALASFLVFDTELPIAKLRTINTTTCKH